MPSSRTRESDWIDGLRGISGIVIVTYHLSEAFNGTWKEPWPAGFDMPFLRIPFSGATALAIFFVITGYVNSVAFLTKARNGDMGLAITSLSKSALTRIGKFVPPVIIASTLDWFLSELHAFDLAAHTDSGWIRNKSVMSKNTTGEALRHLRDSLIYVWEPNGWDEYDATLWPMVRLLQASLDAYLFLFATMKCTTRARRVVLIMLYTWSYISNQSTKGINLWFGVLMADLHTSRSAIRDLTSHRMPKWFSTSLILIGGLFCSYPEGWHENATWSQWTYNAASWIKPHDGEHRRYIYHFGACTFIFGIFHNALAQRILRSDFFVFLGKISLPLYLLHLTLIRTVLVWIVYAPSVLRKDDERHRWSWKELVGTQEETFYKRAGWQGFAIGLPTFYTTLLMLAWLWTQYIDPPCIRAVDWLSAKAYNDDDPGLPFSGTEQYGLTDGEVLSRSFIASPDAETAEDETTLPIPEHFERKDSFGSPTPEPRLPFVLDDGFEMSEREAVSADARIAKKYHGLGIGI